MSKWKIFLQFLLAAVLFSLLFWVIDAAVQRYYFAYNLRQMMFEPPETFLDALLFHLSPQTLFVRIGFLVACLIGGLMAAFFVLQRQIVEERFQTYIQKSPIAVFAADQEGCYTLVNPAACALTGYSEAELLTMGIGDLNDPDQAPQDQDHFRQVRRDASGSTEIAIRRKDGTLVDVQLDAVVLPGEEALAFCRDITERKQFQETQQAAYRQSLERQTAVLNLSEDLRREIEERKQAEAALRNAQMLNQAIIENSPIGISVRSKTGQLLLFNDAWMKIWAIPEAEVKEDMARERWALLFDDSDIYLEAHQEKVRQVYDDGGYLVLPELWIAQGHPGGAEWVSQHFYALMDDDGQVERVVILTVDISEQKKAELALRESEERYRDLVENSFDMICTHDLKGKILTANASAEKMIGFPKDQIVGSNLIDFLVPAVRPQFDHYIDEITANGESSGLMLIVNREGGERIWEYHNSLRTDEIREPIVRGTARDITERVQAERTIKRWNEELEEQVEKRTHDLNIMVESMVGREVRMAGLKKVIKKLRKQLMDAGLTPVADDPLLEPLEKQIMGEKDNLP